MGTAKRDLMWDWVRINESRYERAGWVLIKQKQWRVLGPLENAPPYAVGCLRKPGLAIRLFPSPESAVRAVDTELASRARAKSATRARVS